jgi:uncharacterized protein (PEP-CTERM system associated)
MFGEINTVKNRSLILMCGIALLPGISSAAEWTVSKGVSANLTFTDNSNLSEGGKESDVIVSVTPNISFTGKGGRANVKFAGSLQVDDRGQGEDSINPRIQADADAELVRNLVFIDANARASQNALNPFTSGSSDTASDSENVTTTYSYSISPYVKSRLKGYANFEARYTWDQMFHTAETAGDSSAQAVALSLDSGNKFRSFTWGLQGDYKKVDAESSDSDFKSADVNLGYKFSRKWQVRASAGEEWNDFTSARSETDGVRWDFGIIWTPSRRTSLDIGYGERFFGSTPSLDFSHRSRRSTFKAGYSRELTDARTLIMEQELYILVDDVTGLPIVDPVTGYPVIISRDVAVINDTTLVNERFDASYTLKGKRSTLNIRADHSEQIYQDATGDGSKLMGISVGVDRQLDGKTSANTDVSWRRSESTAGEQADTASLQVGLSRELGPKTHLNVNYRYTERDSETTGDSYDENRVTVGLDIDL